jgi:DNA-binding transcriptional regulator YhcF (GntR family)
MEITIDVDNPLPQFEQLIEQIKAAVTAGVLKPGAALPSIHQGRRRHLLATLAPRNSAQLPR